MAIIKISKIKDNIQIEYLCCDNAWETLYFEGSCKQKAKGVEFKYTAPDIPQKSGHVEWKFTALFNQEHDMLHGGKFSLEKWFVGQSHKECHPSWKLSHHSQQRLQPILAVFWEEKEKYSVFSFKIQWNVHHEILYNSNEPIKVPQAFGLFLHKVIQLGFAMYTNQRWEKKYTKVMTLLQKL